MNCIHDWDFTLGSTGLFKCTKCRALLDGMNAINHLNMLESDLANERALYAEKQDLVKRLADALEELMYGFELWDDEKLVELIAEYRATKAKEMR